MSFLPVKGDGRTVMTCDFVTVVDGMVQFNAAKWEMKKEDPEIKKMIEKIGEERARRAGTILDTSNDGYYTTALCIPDFHKVMLRSSCFKPRALLFYLNFVTFVIKLLCSKSSGVGVLFFSQLKIPTLHFTWP